MNKIKWFFQKLIRGYSDCDLWNLHDIIIKFILPRLKAFRNMKRYGYPSDLKNGKEWNIILDKIIWSLENYDDLSVFDKYSKKEIEELKKKYKEDSTEFMLESIGKYNKEKTEKNEKRFNEGWELFNKHFFGLWD
jgi:hypothetical protein